MGDQIEMHIETVSFEELCKKVEKLTSENQKLYNMYKTEKRKNNRLRKRLNDDAEIVNEWVSLDN
jgi:hypothetical protein|tara:strand:+ start:271 stop:465 length:195 start_codon:yes stop_codon:yes gene_type:complete